VQTEFNRDAPDDEPHTSISRSGSAPIVIGGPGFDFVADQTFCYGRRTSSISSLVRFARTLAAAVTLC
jgi:hypothetical protein